MPVLVGRELRAAQVRRDQATFADGTLASLLEYELQVTSPVRSAVSNTYTRHLYRWLNEAHGERVVVGSEGWIFLKSRVFPPPASSNDILRDWGARLTALQRCLASLGIRIVIIPMPRRPVIEADRLPEHIDPRADIDVAAADKLKQHGLNAVDLYDAFSNYEGEPLFYRADAHWNELGEILTAEETLRQCGLLAPPEERTTRLKQVGVESQGTTEDSNYDLFALAGIFPNEDSELLRGSDIPVHELDPNSGERVNPSEMTRIALSGTSFSERRKFALFLEHFSQLRIHDGSLSGVGPIEPIRWLLQKNPEKRPELFLAEVPVYSAFETGYLIGKEVARLISEHPPETVTPFGPVLLKQLRKEALPLGETVSVGPAGTAVFRTERGSLLSNWDGLVGLRVKGETTKGIVEFHTLRRGFGHPTQWAKGKHETYVPLIDLKLKGNGFRLNASSLGDQARFRLDSAEFVSTVDLEHRIPLKKADEGVLEHRWFVDFAVPAATHTEDDRALVIGPWKGDSWKTDTISILAVDPTTKKFVRRLARGYIAKGGWVFVSLGALGATENAVLRIAASNNQVAPPVEATVGIVPNALVR